MTRRTSLQKSQRPKSDRRKELSISASGVPEPLASDMVAAAARAFSSQGVQRGTLEITVVGDARMRREHARWMNDNTPTDVLTFDLRDTPKSRVVDGALIVCRSVARRRAKEHGTDWKKELLLYVVHGCLHLCGYDDHDESDAARMHEEEDRILKSLGWGAVFAARKTRRRPSKT